MASSWRPDQLGTKQRSDEPITGKPPRLAVLGQAPGRLWLRIRSAYKGRRTTSADARSSQKVEQPQTGLVIVLEAPGKVASSTGSLSEGATKLGTAAIPRVAAADELAVSLRQAYSADGDSAEGSSRFLLPGTGLRGIANWLLIGSAMVLLVAIPLVVLQVVSPRFRGLGALAAQVSGGPSSGGSEGQTSGSSDASPSVGGATIPGADFTGAYILEVRKLSSSRTMLRILVPAGVVGDYRAEVALEETSDFQCVVLEDRTNELFCIGPMLPTGNANISIYHLNDRDDSSFLVFEVSYFIVEDTIIPGPVFPEPVPPVVPYGTGFVWPDRFNEAEVERESASNSVLAPASALVTMLVMGVWLLPRPKPESNRRRTR